MSTNRIRIRRAASTLVRTALLGVCLVLFAASCGQRGPLYLPKPDAHAGGTAPAKVEAGDSSGEPAADEHPVGDDEDSDEKTP